MNFLTRKVSWANWQFGLLKIAMISFGILLGVYFSGNDDVAHTLTHSRRGRLA